MWTTVRSFLGMIRFSHTIFALPFALLAALLAWQDVRFQPVTLIGILSCMICARTAAMGFNRLADRHIDAKNPRTANRHLPAGQLSAGSVWALTLLSAAAFVASTTIFIFARPPNPWPPILAVPVLIFICAYSFTKRFTALAHFWLGVSLMLAPVAAWIAIRGFADMATPLVLGAAVQFWVSGFDILYACQDADFDRREGLRSVPAWLGIKGALRVALACHMMMLAFLAALFFVSPPLGTVYLVGLAAIAGLVAYQHWLVRPDDLSRVNRAFFQVNGVISIGLFLIVLLQVLMN
jgi:4-hydroxybenzoate polyprenyltransferase